MMNAVTPEEQRAIDGFLAKQKVTKVPAGTSSYRPLKWDEPSRSLREVNPDGSFLTQEQYRSELKRKNRKNIGVSIRRGKVRGLSKDMTAPQIADLLGVSADVVRQDLKTMGISAVRAKSARKTWPAQTKINRELVRTAMQEGHATWQEVHEATGLDRKACQRHMKAIEAGR